MSVLVKPMPFREALERARKIAIPSKFLSSEWSDVPVALRERAFFSSQVENARFLQRAMDLITDFLEGNREVTESGEPALKNAGRAQFVQEMSEFAEAQGMGPLEGMEGTLRDITSESRLSLIFNTQVQQAHDYGYWRQGQDPDVLDEFPAQKFIRVKAVKDPRDSHIPYEDQTFLKNDPIWKRINEDFGVPWGPWGWGCGHDVSDCDRAEAEQLGLLKPGQTVEPDTANFNDNLKASTHSLAPELLDKLTAEFGDQVVVNHADQTIGWKGDESAGKPPAPAMTARGGFFCEIEVPVVFTARAIPATA